MKLNLIEALNAEEIGKIDCLSREILSKKGILIPSSEVKDTLVKKGIRFDGFIAKFDDKAIEDSLNSVPPNIKLFNSDLSGSIDIGKDTKYASGHNAIYMFDKNTKKRIPAKKNEVANFALVADFLEDIDIVGIEAYPQDVNPKSSILHGLDAVLNNTAKPVYFSPENYIEVEFLLKIIESVSPDFKNLPIGICQVSPHSPLAWDEVTIKALIMLAEKNFPVVVLPAPFSFVSSPITLAGEILQSNIELLSALVITQLINPGTPFIFGNAKSDADMATGEYLIGTPECSLFRTASAQIAKYYNVPSHSIGPDTDANQHDIQNGFEKGMSLAAASIADTSIIVNAGMFATGMTVSYEQLLIDAEMIKFMKRFKEGIDVVEEKLAYKSLLDVEHGKDFIADPLTIKYMRSNEHVKPFVSNRRNYHSWIQAGTPDISDNAEKLAGQILKNHRPKSIDRSIKTRITLIIDEFEKKYRQ
ncbi:MAG: hypothetical protein FJW68_05920 [Actinobacteria bacterium]|nr:hypothetical protein [Actinomycetota bacterium]